MIPQNADMVTKFSIISLFHGSTHVHALTSAHHKYMYNVHGSGSFPFQKKRVSVGILSNCQSLVDGFQIHSFIGYLDKLATYCRTVLQSNLLYM